MLNGKKTVIVIPSYNVEKEIRKTIETLPDFVDYIIAVDDCSKDQTANVISKIMDKRLFLIKNKINLGVGGATVAGLVKGLELGGDIFVKFDGDGQMDPNKMKDLISPLFAGFDYAKGNRFLNSPELKKMPLIRLLGNFALTFLTKISSGYWKIFDPQNGYLAITKESLECLPLERIYKRYFFENDMLINLNIIGAKVKDVEMAAIYGDEKSNLKISKILSSFPWLLFNRFFVRIYKKYLLRDFSVIGVFYLWGIFLMFFGTLFGSYHWILSVNSGVPSTTGTVMIAVLPIILGFQLFIEGIVLEVNEC